MRPCVGIEGVCPALCKWSDIIDGTYNLADIERFHITMDEVLNAFYAAKDIKK